MFEIVVFGVDESNIFFFVWQFGIQLFLFNLFSMGMVLEDISFEFFGGLLSVINSVDLDFISFSWIYYDDIFYWLFQLNLVYIVMFNWEGVLDIGDFGIFDEML